MKAQYVAPNCHGHAVRYGARRGSTGGKREEAARAVHAHAVQSAGTGNYDRRVSRADTGAWLGDERCAPARLLLHSWVRL
jgi:hypothetical protein